MSHRPIAVAVLACFLACFLALGWSQTPAEYSSAMGLVREGKPEVAIPLLEKILAAAPNDLKARNLLGIALLNAGRKEEASVQFQLALKADPGFLPALKNLAINEYTLGRRQEARGHFEQLLKASPADPAAHLHLGEMEFADAQYGAAFAHYTQDGGLHLQDSRVLLHFLKCAVETKQAGAAREAVQHLPADAFDAHFEAGVLLAGAGVLDAAAREFRLARPGYSDPYAPGFNLTLVLFNARDYSGAIEAGESVAREHPKAELYNLLSRAYEASGRTQAAYDALRAATRLDPADETNYLDLMALCLSHENWDLALEISDVALSRIASPWRVRLQRGAVFAMKGRVEEAERECAAASKEAPGEALPAVMQAVLWLEMKKPGDVIELLRALRAKGTKDGRVDWLLGEALHQAGRDAEAIAVLKSSVVLNAGAVAPRVLLGKLLVQAGDSESARGQFEAALRIDPNQVGAAYQLALLYRRAGQVARAEDLMVRVGKATSAPDSPGVSGRDLVRIVREGH